MLADIEIVFDGRKMGRQKVRLSGSDARFKITRPCVRMAKRAPKITAKRFLQHTKLTAIHWINVARDYVSFRTLEKERTGK